MTRFPWGWRSCALWVPVLFAVLFAAGCSPQRGTLTGQVFFQGKPLPGGRLTFRPDDSRQNSLTVPIAPDGTYEAVLVVGEGGLSVDNRELRPPSDLGGLMPPGVNIPPPQGGAKASGPAPTSASGRLAGTFVQIPKKFYDVETSGRRYDVKAGEANFDIHLD
jgi:hypothetical protein